MFLNRHISITMVCMLTHALCATEITRTSSVRESTNSLTENLEISAEVYYQQLKDWHTKKTCGVSNYSRLLCPRNAFTEGRLGILKCELEGFKNNNPEGVSAFRLSDNRQQDLLPYLHSDGTMRGTLGKYRGTEHEDSILHCVDILPQNSPDAHTIILMNLPHKESTSCSLFSPKLMFTPAMVTLHKIVDHGSKANLGKNEFRGANHAKDNDLPNFFDRSNDGDYYVTMNIKKPVYRWNPRFLRSMGAATTALLVTMVYVGYKLWGK